MVAALVGIGGSAPARADSGGIDSTAKIPPDDKGAGLVGLKVGAFLPEPFSSLGPSYFVEVEGGYLLPFVHRLIGITGSVAMGMPTIGTTLSDPRVPGGSYTYTQTTQQFMLGLTVVAKIPLGRFVPYIGIGPRLFLVRTPSSGSAADGTAIPQSVELSRDVGVGVPAGLDILLGPGRLFAELQFLYSGSSQLSTGPGNFGALSVAAGYRLVLGGKAKVAVEQDTAPMPAPPPPAPPPPDAAPPAASSPAAEPPPAAPQ